MPKGAPSRNHSRTSVSGSLVAQVHAESSSTSTEVHTLGLIQVEVVKYALSAFSKRLLQVLPRSLQHRSAGPSSMSVT
eukprot:3535615-Amphidinium_carterae.1